MTGSLCTWLKNNIQAASENLADKRCLQATAAGEEEDSLWAKHKRVHLQHGLTIANLFIRLSSELVTSHSQNDIPDQFGMSEKAPLYPLLYNVWIAWEIDSKTDHIFLILFIAVSE